jgi:hypothetical protein
LGTQAAKRSRGPLLGLAALGIGGLAALWLVKSNGRDPANDPSLIPQKDVAPVSAAPAVNAQLPGIAPQPTAVVAPELPAASAAGPQVPAPQSAQSSVANRPRGPRPVPTTPKRRPGKAEDDIYGDR